MDLGTWQSLGVVDEAGLFLIVGNAALRLLGVSDLEGRAFQEFLPAAARPSFLAALAAAAEGGAHHVELPGPEVTEAGAPARHYRLTGTRAVRASRSVLLEVCLDAQARTAVAMREKAELAKPSGSAPF